MARFGQSVPTASVDGLSFALSWSTLPEIIWQSPWYAAARTFVLKCHFSLVSHS
jgi:hypothetical protein